MLMSVRQPLYFFAAVCYWSSVCLGDVPCAYETERIVVHNTNAYWNEAAVILNVSYCQIIQWKDQTSSALVPLSTSWLACLVWDEAHKQETAGHVRFWQLLGNRVLFGTIFSGGLIHILSSEYTFILFRLWKNMSVSATVWFRLCVFEQQCGSFSQGNIIFGHILASVLVLVFS